jgi:hypothetical protein
LLTEYYTGYSVLDDIDFSSHATAKDQLSIGAVEEPQPEPRREAYPSTALYLKAKASWYLASQASSKHRSAALQEQQTLSVKPTFIPKLPWIDETPEEDSFDYLDSFNNRNTREE